MGFKFLCPQGHLLEGDSSQAGQPCGCPECGTTFLVPQVAPRLVEDEPAASQGAGGAPIAAARAPLPIAQSIPIARKGGGDFALKPFQPPSAAPPPLPAADAGDDYDLAPEPPEAAAPIPAPFSVGLPPADEPGGIELPFDPKEPTRATPFELPGGELPDLSSLDDHSLPFEIGGDEASPREDSGLPFDLLASDAGQREDRSLPFEIPDEDEAPAGGAAGVELPFSVGPEGKGVSDASPRILHILCPSGHVLETPPEYLGQKAMCPFCQETFVLRTERSVEYQRKVALRQKREEQADEKVGRIWLGWAIAAAVLVAGGVLALIAAAAAMH
jgi:hypothetical protein